MLFFCNCEFERKEVKRQGQEDGAEYRRDERRVMRRELRIEDVRNEKLRERAREV